MIKKTLAKRRKINKKHNLIHEISFFEKCEKYFNQYLNQDFDWAIIILMSMVKRSHKSIEEFRDDINYFQERRLSWLDSLSNYINALIDENKSIDFNLVLTFQEILKITLKTNRNKRNDSLQKQSNYFSWWEGFFEQLEKKKNSLCKKEKKILANHKIIDNCYAEDLKFVNLYVNTILNGDDKKVNDDHLVCF